MNYGASNSHKKFVGKVITNEPSSIWLKSKDEPNMGSLQHYTGVVEWWCRVIATNIVGQFIKLELLI